MVRAGWKRELPLGSHQDTHLAVLVQYVYVVSMNKEKKDVRLQLVVSPSDVQAIDEWRRQQPDLPSRSEAIRRMIHAAVGGGTVSADSLRII